MQLLVLETVLTLNTFLKIHPQEPTAWARKRIPVSFEIPFHGLIVLKFFPMKDLGLVRVNLMMDFMSMFKMLPLLKFLK